LGKKSKEYYFMTYEDEMRPSMGPTPIISATQEAVIKRTSVQGLPRQKVSKTPSQQISQE
jgi:hypothetical protein